MLAAPIAALSVNQQRLWDTLHHTAQWGDSKDGGVRRLALTKEDQAVREWFVNEAQKYGATVKVDEMGNIFAIRKGRNNELPLIGIGSHLDTQPAGGRYDGILGVQAGLEILKVLHEKQYSTYAPIAVISKLKPTVQKLLKIIKLMFPKYRLDKRRRGALQHWDAIECRLGWENHSRARVQPHRSRGSDFQGRTGQYWLPGIR